MDKLTDAIMGLLEMLPKAVEKFIIDALLWIIDFFGGLL